MSQNKSLSSTSWLTFDAFSIFAKLESNLPTFLQQKENILSCFQKFQERTQSKIPFGDYKSAIENAILYYVYYGKKVPNTTIEEDEKQEQVRHLYRECINFIGDMPTNIASFGDKYRKKTEKVINKN